MKVYYWYYCTIIQLLHKNNLNIWRLNVQLTFFLKVALFDTVWTLPSLKGNEICIYLFFYTFVIVIKISGAFYTIAADRDPSVLDIALAQVVKDPNM